MIFRASIIRRSTSHSEAISRLRRVLFVIVLLSGPAAYPQSIFLDGGYVIGDKAAGMAAYIAAPDFAHAVQLNPAGLGYVGTLYAATDYEYFSRDVGLLFLPDTPTDLLTNGRLSAWDASLAFPVGQIGIGASFNSYDLAGWRTTVSCVGAGVPLPLGFSIGATAKYVSVEKPTFVPGGSSAAKLNRVTFDIGAMNRTELANTTFFRAILSSGVVFTNVLAPTKWRDLILPSGQQTLNVDLPQTFGFGVAYTFASNYRLYDFELFRVTAAVDYSHILGATNPMDGFTLQRDSYRIGLETTALGVLAVRLGYTLKTPVIQGYDSYSHLTVARMGSGFSYGFSLRFPLKLVLPSVPITSLEVSYAKNPEWNSGMYHDIFGAVFELLF